MCSVEAPAAPALAGGSALAVADPATGSVSRLATANAKATILMTAPLGFISQMRQNRKRSRAGDGVGVTAGFGGRGAKPAIGFRKLPGASLQLGTGIWQMQIKSSQATRRAVPCSQGPATAARSEFRSRESPGVLRAATVRSVAVTAGCGATTSHARSRSLLAVQTSTATRGVTSAFGSVDAQFAVA
jgi:hypothetical protein